MNSIQKTATVELLPTDGMNLAAMRENVGNAVRLLKSLANESRLMIMCVLAEGELSVGALNERISLSQSALSQHLALLRTQGMVKTRRESQTIFYSLTDNAAIKVIETLHDVYCAPMAKAGRRC